MNNLVTIQIRLAHGLLDGLNGTQSAAFHREVEYRIKQLEMLEGKAVSVVFHVDIAPDGTEKKCYHTEIRTNSLVPDDQHFILADEIEDIIDDCIHDVECDVDDQIRQGMTNGGLNVVEHAYKRATIDSHSGTIGTEHLLFGIVCAECISKYLLSGVHVTDARVFEQLGQLDRCHLKGYSIRIVGLIGERRFFSRRAKSVLIKSAEYAIEARRLVSPEHMLRAILEESEGIAARIIVNLGGKIEEIRKTLFRSMGWKGGP